MDMGRGELGDMSQGGAAVGGMDGGDMGHVGRVLHDGVLDVIQRFGSNSKDRRILVDYHFAQIESALLPPYAKFLLWMMCMGKSFFRGKGSAVRASKKGGADGDDGNDNENAPDDGAGGSEGGVGGVGGAEQGATLWALLSNELGLTFDQVGFVLEIHAAVSLPFFAPRRSLPYCFVDLVYILTQHICVAIVVAAIARRVRDLFTYLCDLISSPQLGGEAEAKVHCDGIRRDAEKSSPPGRIDALPSHAERRSSDDHGQSPRSDGRPTAHLDPGTKCHFPFMDGRQSGDDAGARAREDSSRTSGRVDTGHDRPRR